jgi:Flp pilus assembly protein TadG
VFSSGKRIRRFITILRFGQNRSGSVAIIFGLTVFVLGGLVALSLDYGRALTMRAKLQAAVDAAALAADPTGNATLAQATDSVTATFNANMVSGFLSASVTLAPPVVIANGYRVSAIANVPTSFGRLLGFNVIPVGAQAEAVHANNTVEIALVLDNTYSMNGAKLDALKVSAKNLVNTISGASTPGSVKFSLVPFTAYVNVGMQYRGASWMSVPADYSVANGWCTTVCNGPTQTQSGTCYSDGVPYTCTWDQCMGASTQQCSTAYYAWSGCAGSRTPAPDVTVTASMGSAIPGLLNTWCSSPVVRLTTDPNAVTTQIDAMWASGETYIPAGLIWGWRTLDPNSPFGDGAPYNNNPPVKKIMILMTDGYNTKSQTGTNHEGSDSAAADAVTARLCTAIKNASIELYTIDFEVSSSTAKAAMLACATDGSHYFDAQDTASLDAAFNKIAGFVMRLYLSK